MERIEQVPERVSDPVKRYEIVEKAYEELFIPEKADTFDDKK